MTTLPQYWNDRQADPGDHLPPTPAPEVFEGLLLVVPMGLVPWRGQQTNIMRIEATDWIDGEWCFYAVAVRGNRWATWFPLATAVRYLLDYFDHEQDISICTNCHAEEWCDKLTEDESLCSDCTPKRDQDYEDWLDNLPAWERDLEAALSRADDARDDR